MCEVATMLYDRYSASLVLNLSVLKLNKHDGQSNYVSYIPICRRFCKDDLARLATALSLPEQYTCSQGTTVTGIEALLVMLRRLTYPNRLCDLVPLFGRSEYELSLIFSKVSMYVHQVVQLIT